MIAEDQVYNPEYSPPAKGDVSITLFPTPEPPKPDSNPPGGEQEYQYQITNQDPADQQEPGNDAGLNIPGFTRWVILIAAGLVILMMVNE